MKLRHASIGASLCVLAGAAILLAAGGCHHPQRRNDWRSPSPPMTGPNDPASSPPGDGGALPPGQPARPVHPALPNVQPSSSDIQL